MEEDFPQRIAGMLESVADKVRSLTVDRIATAVKWIAMGPILTVLAIIAIWFLLIGLFRIGGEVVGGTRIIYAIVGGLFVVVALFLWSRRHDESEDDQT